ncbi:MAG: hypothetical protein DRJ67_05275 [Thermoprotei archaeon]|nr:MAG: hypothetical protein DRJ67_05275 [Thermoprotei archaeon]
MQIVNWDAGYLLSLWRRRRIVVPEFQRRFCWDSRRQREWIDTLRRHLPVPPLILAHDEERDEYIVVDGQQRIVTTVLYLSGKLPLPQDWTREVRSAVIPVEIIRDFSLGELEMLFERINKGALRLTWKEIIFTTKRRMPIVAEAIRISNSDLFLSVTGIREGDPDWRRMQDRYLALVGLACIHLGRPIHSQMRALTYRVIEEVDERRALILGHAFETVLRDMEARWSPPRKYFVPKYYGLGVRRGVSPHLFQVMVLLVRRFGAEKVGIYAYRVLSKYDKLWRLITGNTKMLQEFYNRVLQDFQRVR